MERSRQNWPQADLHVLVAELPETLRRSGFNASEGSIRPALPEIGSRAGLSLYGRQPSHTGGEETGRTGPRNIIAIAKRAFARRYVGGLSRIYHGPGPIDVWSRSLWEEATAALEPSGEFAPPVPLCNHIRPASLYLAKHLSIARVSGLGPDLIEPAPLVRAQIFQKIDALSVQLRVRTSTLVELSRQQIRKTCRSAKRYDWSQPPVLLSGQEVRIVGGCALEGHSLPIRLLPTPTKCRVGPFSGVELIEGRSRGPAGDSEQ
jgi:hypothetical protein